MHDGTPRFKCSFYSLCLYSFEMFASLLSADLFSWSRAGFQAFSPPRVYLSVWTCSPGGIVEVGVLSGLIAMWCLVGRRAWLGRRWGKTSCPHSLLSLSHLFSVSPALFPPLLSFSFLALSLSLTLYMTTQNDGSPAWLINWQREMDRHKRMGKRERCREGSPQISQTQVTPVLTWCLLTTSKTLDARRGATWAAKWVRNIEGSPAT